ncbi:MAG: PDZ domain-containing protein, partial [Gemmatimonadetes bacterium]|nr:PDZ domain-containing protein [Gemmatimonadota bacterium]
MRASRFWMPLLAAMLMAPAALSAQQGGGEGRGWMGVAFNWDSAGAREARVAEVVPGSAAQRAGLRTGDVVVRINSGPATEQAVDRLRQELEVGDTVRVRIRRGRAEEERRVIAMARPETRVGRLPREVIVGDGDRRVTIRVDSIRPRLDSLARRVEVLRSRVRTREHGDSVVVYSFDRADGRRGDSVVVNLRSLDRMGRALGRELESIGTREIERLPFYMEVGRRAVAGAELSELNPELARYFRVDDGVLVLQVARSTPAARAGLQGGDVIVRAAGRSVGSVADLRRAFGEREG